MKVYSIVLKCLNISGRFAIRLLSANNEGRGGRDSTNLQSPTLDEVFSKVSRSLHSLCVHSIGKLSKVRLGQGVARRYSLLHLLCCEPLKHQLHIP